MKERIIVFLLILIVVSSCRKEKTQTIPDEFVSFVDGFFEEAFNRNVDLNLSDFNLEIKLEDIQDHAGTCNTRNSVIRIDEETWLNIDDQQKEWLIYHELGHCILERSHNNNKASNGECLSFMNEQMSNPDCSSNLYSVMWRDYYLDELFNDCQELPDWYSTNQEYVDNGNRIYQVDTTVTATGFGDLVEFDLNKNFVIEFEFFNWTEVADFISILWGNNNSFSFCKTCIQNNLSISLNQKTIYYNSDVENIGDNSKLTIKKINDRHLFFFNEQFVHTFEYTEWENNSFGTIIWAEEIGTEITMDIKVYILE